MHVSSIRIHWQQLPLPSAGGVGLRLVFLSLLLSAPLVAEDKVGFIPNSYIGFWHDGSGVIRDASPVQTWRDFNYIVKKEKNKRGKIKPKVVPDRSTAGQAQNIVWQVPHYNYCNGGMIIVKGKIYALTDRAGLGFCIDKPADFTGAPLSCFDAASGKELWRIDLNHWDLVPNGEALASDLRAYNQKYPEMYKAYQSIALALGLKGKQLKGEPLTQASYAVLRDAFNKVAEVPAPELLEDAHNSKLKAKGYVQTSFASKGLPTHWPSMSAIRGKLIKQGGYLIDAWLGLIDHLGLNMQTPVSDGEHIWISTGFGAVFCVDLDGKVVWKHWFGKGFGAGWAIPSPILVGDKLIVNGIDSSTKHGFQRVAFDKNSGKILWTQLYGEKGFYVAAPLALSLPIAGDSSQMLDVLLFHNGDILRTEDGKKIASGLGGSSHARPWAAERHIVALVNEAADGGAYHGTSQFSQYKKQLIVLEFSAPSRDEVTAKLLWNHKPCQRYTSGLIVKDGKLYWLDDKKYTFHVHDLKTGTILATCNSPTGPNGIKARSFHLPFIAGQYYLAHDQSGYSAIFDLGADGASPKPLSFNPLSPPATGPSRSKFNYGAQALISGNRIFFRSNEQLYCIGDPKADMVLSAIHR